MVHLSLCNIKEDEKNNVSNIKKFHPYKINLSNYIIKIKSNIPIHIQFYLNEKLMKFIKIKYDKTTYKYNKVPPDGILISCIISSDNSLEISFEPIDLCSEIIFKEFKKNIYYQLGLTNINYDNIFIINLKRRTDRKEDMINKLKEQNITNYEFIEAVDGTEQSVIDKFTELKNNKKTRIITSGHFACLLSHIKAIKLAKSRNYSNIMILEDDIYFCKNFISKLSNLIIPNYDMIYLGGIISKKKLFFNDWVRYSNIMGAYGYILKSNLFDIVLEQLEKLTQYVDVFYMTNIQLFYSTILLFDYIKTDLASSDTSHKSSHLVQRLNYIKIR
jgi:GR25 family glycosyltransferase involved in LPS biosynthesis